MDPATLHHPPPGSHFSCSTGYKTKSDPKRFRERMETPQVGEALRSHHRTCGEGGKQHSCVVQSSGLTLMQKEKNTYQKILTEVVKSAAAISGHRWSDAGGCPSWGTHSLAFSFIPESQPGTCLVSVLGVQLGSSIQPRPAYS